MMCLFICKNDQDLFPLFNEIKWSNNNCELRAVWHNTPYAVSFSNIKCHYIRLRVLKYEFLKIRLVRTVMNLL